MEHNISSNISPDKLFVSKDTTIYEAFALLERTGFGILLLIVEGRLARTVTDGDLRRLLLAGKTMDSSLSSLPHKEPHFMTEGFDVEESRLFMEKYGIAHLPILDSSGRPVQVLRERDIKRILLSPPHIGELELDYVRDAFDTNWIAPVGPNVDGFESEMAQFLGISHAAAVSSGTAALHLALLLLGVRSGDDVLCSSLTFAASANPIKYIGANPVFVDSEPLTWNMCHRALRMALEDRINKGFSPKAVIVVNLYGQSADMHPILEVCQEYDVKVIEDAAESLGAKYKGKNSGTFGDIGVYSFNGNKIITTSGGGMLVSNQSNYVERAKYLATQARLPVLHYEHTEVGYNYRLSNVLAGIGRGQLKVLEERVHRRREIFERYRLGLAGLSNLEWMPEPPGFVSTRWLSVVKYSGQRGIDDIVTKSNKRGIEVRQVWMPMHMQPLYRGASYYSCHDDLSGRLFQNGICLPSGSQMTNMEVDRVIAALSSLLS